MAGRVRVHRHGNRSDRESAQKEREVLAGQRSQPKVRAGCH